MLARTQMQSEDRLQCNGISCEKKCTYCRHLTITGDTGNQPQLPHLDMTARASTRDITNPRGHVDDRIHTTSTRSFSEFVV